MLETKLVLSKEKLPSFYKTLENPREYGNIKFKNDKKIFMIENEYKCKNLIDLENCVFNEKFCYLFLICEPDIEEASI